MLGQNQQHPKTKIPKVNEMDVLRKAKRLTTDFGCQYGSTKCWHVDHGYRRLHHKAMQANRHYHIECTSMQVGELTNLRLEKE